MSLPDALAKAVKEGKLDTLALYYRDGKWQANAKHVRGGWQCIPCTDPVTGLEKALTSLLGWSAQQAEAGQDEDIFG